MSEKDNIKLKTDTLSSRKSNASVGVHVKRKERLFLSQYQKNQRERMMFLLKRKT